MVDLHIIITDPVHTWLEEEAAREGLSSADQFVKKLISERQAEAALEQEVLKALDGRLRPVDDDYWADLQRRVELRCNRQ